MSPRGLLLTALVFVGATGALIQYREPLLLEFGLEGWDPVYMRAVELAKSERSLERYHTNYFTIQHRAKLEGGAIDPDGWKATRENESAFLVSYRAKIGARVVEYDFVVDTGIREVFVRKDDPKRPDAPPSNVAEIEFESEKAGRRAKPGR